MSDDDATKTVLIVDDQEGLTDLYTHYLTNGYETRIANGGEAALERMDEGVDVVLLDRQMPALSGDDVLAEYRDRGFTQPVAMVSAVYPEPEIIGFDIDEYLIKPVLGENIRETVDTLAARAECEPDRREYLALLSKKAALEANKSGGELEFYEEYKALQRKLADLRESDDVATVNPDPGSPAAEFDESP